MEKNKDSCALIWKTVSSIPRGRVATYGQIADLAGLSRSARYTGYALKKLPKNTKIPWHRVITAAGKIAFPETSEAHKAQKQKLLDEGVIFQHDKINLKQFGWTLDLDSLLWKP